MTKTLHQTIKERYDVLRVGQAIYVATTRVASARVTAVGRKYIYLLGHGKVTSDTIINWWYS